MTSNIETEKTIIKLSEAFNVHFGSYFYSHLYNMAILLPEAEIWVMGGILRRLSMYGYMLPTNHIDIDVLISNVSQQKIKEKLHRYSLKTNSFGMPKIRMNCNTSIIDIWSGSGLEADIDYVLSTFTINASTIAYNLKTKEIRHIDFVDKFLANQEISLVDSKELFCSSSKCIFHHLAYIAYIYEKTGYRIENSLKKKIIQIFEEVPIMMNGSTAKENITSYLVNSKDYPKDKAWNIITKMLRHCHEN